MRQRDTGARVCVELENVFAVIAWPASATASSLKVCLN